jgi:large subunit ribosomal protein L25
VYNPRCSTLGGCAKEKGFTMAKIEMTAKLRNVAGKGAARKVRNNKNVPAVIYGNKKDPIAIEIDGHDFGEMIKKPGLRTKLFVIDAGKTKENAMLMDVQYHPVKDTPMHADFKRVDITKPVSVNVPITLINVEICKGLKTGGALNFAVRSVALLAMVDDIPEKIEIDLQNMNITDTFHGRDLKLPKGVELGLHQANLALVTITGKMKEEKEEAKAAAATAAAPAAGDAKKAAPAGDAKKAEPAKSGDSKK